jgi:uncharacterized RDD family membrane protein YckC
MRDSERQPSPLEKRLMAALALKDVRELDRLLEKSPEPGLELENTPPKEEYEMCPPQEDGTEAVDEQDALVYASMWERLKAFICDFAVIFLAVGLLVVGVNAIEKPAFTGTLILVAYMILAQWIWHTTIGKYLFGLEVRTVSPNRRYPSFWALFSRETGGRLVSMPLLCAGYWSGIGHPRSQAWSDRIAATIVVKRPTTASIKGLLKVLVIVSLLFVICVCGVYVYSLTARF